MSGGQEKPALSDFPNRKSKCGRIGNILANQRRDMARNGTSIAKFGATCKTPHVFLGPHSAPLGSLCCQTGLESAARGRAHAPKRGLSPIAVIPGRPGHWFGPVPPGLVRCPKAFVEAAALGGAGSMQNSPRVAGRRNGFHAEFHFEFDKHKERGSRWGPFDDFL